MYDDVRVQLSPADLRSRDLPGSYIKILTEVSMQIRIKSECLFLTFSLKLKEYKEAQVLYFLISFAFIYSFLGRTGHPPQ